MGLRKRGQPRHALTALPGCHLRAGTLSEPLIDPTRRGGPLHKVQESKAFSSSRVKLCADLRKRCDFRPFR